MRNTLIALGSAVGLISTAGFAQMAGTGPGGRPLDIRNTDLGAHDSFSTPDMHDQLLRQRDRELADRLQAEHRTLGPARPAKRSELAAGAAVNDNTGAAMAIIQQVDRDGVVVSLGAAKVKVPTEAFGHNKAGLLLDMTKAEFQQMVAKANGS
ncbi:MAG TPA: hypothetical protein VF750_01145 [Sphingomicrobium sp.]